MFPQFTRILFHTHTCTRKVFLLILASRVEFIQMYNLFNFMFDFSSLIVKVWVPISDGVDSYFVFFISDPYELKNNNKFLAAHPFRKGYLLF